MRLLVLIGVWLLGVMLASTASLVALGQPSEAEAKSAFERLGCTTCHRSGGIGNSWDAIVSRYKALAGKHDSLDVFVEAEVYQKVKSMLGVEVRSWDELFVRMAQYSGKRPDDPNLNVVQSYLASLLGAQAPEVTPPQIMTPPQITTPPAATPVEERGVSFLVAALAALIIVAASVLAALWLARG